MYVRKISEYSRSELQEMNLNELIGSEDHSAAEEHFINLKKTGKTQDELIGMSISKNFAILGIREISDQEWNEKKCYIVIR